MSTRDGLNKFNSNDCNARSGRLPVNSQSLAHPRCHGATAIEMEQQLDLFVHNRDLMLRNDVIGALRRRNVLAGRETLKFLSAEFPDDNLLLPLETLLNALGAPVEQFSGHHGVSDAILNMDTVVIPAANLVFGDKEACAWLAPMWQGLANSAAGLPYNVERPHTHAASL